MAKRTNRVAWSLAAVLGVVVHPARAVENGPFADIPSRHPAKAAVDELAQRGLVNGYPDGAYHGNQAMTRYEVAVFLARILQQSRQHDFSPLVLPSKPPAAPPLSDVPLDHWAADSVQEAHDWGLLLGRPDGTFAGDRVMSRAEFAVALQRLHTYLIRFVELNQQNPPKGR
jgi:S-layer homology domain